MDTPIRQIQKWASSQIPAQERFGCFAEVMAKSFTPLKVDSCMRNEFDITVTWTDFGTNSAFRLAACEHVSARGKREIAQSEERVFHLFVNLNSRIHFTHLNKLTATPGDALFYDSRIDMRLELPEVSDVVNLKLSEIFVKQWVARPSVLLGRRIDSRFGWGKALCAFAAQLTPQAIQRSPVPRDVISDQLGALLALTAGELDTTTEPPSRPEISLCDKIRDCVAQHCVNPALVAAEIAQALNISPRTLHRALAGRGETFGNLLMSSRVDVALRMLTSPSFKRLTTAEIGRRAGFTDASHFGRVFRKHVGTTPAQVRQVQGTRSDA
ncbi:AraC family transcriptional regulator [Silvimonas iriomotensis]|uniref:HTH araC/xylS-type domain-containing protein n=1 Tax=Silvimonas iriomotensis TaxID=449662 RepID=A0ABQ2P770_9NEIS|nr:AraC family transcriptional regulator [Silvimonas iriomotensis]GGP19345.1 hypothetical protein GCM10010970_10150 [Silvimonas iriomotensis]